jgi:hypothetical protein
MGSRSTWQGNWQLFLCREHFPSTKTCTILDISWLRCQCLLPPTIMSRILLLNSQWICVARELTSTHFTFQWVTGSSVGVSDSSRKVSLRNTQEIYLKKFCNFLFPMNSTQSVLRAYRCCIDKSSFRRILGCDSTILRSNSLNQSLMTNRLDLRLYQ